MDTVLSRVGFLLVELPHNGSVLVVCPDRDLLFEVLKEAEGQLAGVTDSAEEAQRGIRFPPRRVRAGNQLEGTLGLVEVQRARANGVLRAKDRGSAANSFFPFVASVFGE